jgi:DNA uptake protein ComE-like DNA-binding protein
MDRAWPLAAFSLLAVLGLSLTPSSRPLTFEPLPPSKLSPALTAQRALSPQQLLLADIKLDINQASAAELRALPEIGEGLAQAIVTARRAAPLRCTADLSRIAGFGSGRLGRVLPFLKPLPEQCSNAGEGVE